MPHAAALRLEIETALATRIPGALTPRPRVLRNLAATGIGELDAVLDGGLPIGAISELVGAHSSGRTTLALATMAEMTQGGSTVAWVDASDTLDPESAAAAGVDLTRQLWVRCGPGASPAQPKAAIPEPSASRGAAFLVEGNRVAATSGGCGSPHPRGEARGLSEAVDAFLQPADVFSRPAPPRDPAVPRRNRMIGTPSAPNRKVLDRTPQDARPLSRRARDREEQIPTDRQPSRRQTMNAQRQEWGNAKTLRDKQILTTAEVAASRPRAGAWTDNANNAHGRNLATPPNAIAAGMPRFREMEARAAGQGHGLAEKVSAWKPTFDAHAFHGGESTARERKQSTQEASRAAKQPIQAGNETAESQITGKARVGEPVEASLAGELPRGMKHKASPIWQRLDQALRATDLLLAAGGFSAIVLDLGDIPPEFAWRVPLATWFRFRAAADRARTVLLVLTQHPCARSSAELVLQLSPVRAQGKGTVLTGAQFRVVVDRRRFEVSPSAMPAIHVAPEREVQVNTLHLVSARKQPQPEREAKWRRTTAWTGTDQTQPQGGLR